MNAALPEKGVRPCYGVAAGMQKRVSMAGARVAGLHLATARPSVMHGRAATLARSCVMHNPARAHFFLKFS